MQIKNNGTQFLLYSLCKRQTLFLHVCIVKKKKNSLLNLIFLPAGEKNENEKT